MSAMLSLTPVLSFSATELVVSFGWWSGVFTTANIDVLSFMGIVLIVCAVFVVQIVPMYQKRKQAKAFRTVL